jgi:glycosyltransferase involved in cell wall biosynthesis
MELTILMPCLNESATIATCIAKARAFLTRANIHGEVLVSDNGSTDGSQAIAQSIGARVIAAEQRGYGAALIAGIQHARGRFVIMGDSDDSYDFTRLDLFVEQLRKGCDLVMGNRFSGGIASGAMPPLHRYLGNPVLSFIGRRLYGTPIRDFHCGLRGFNREAIQAINLRCSGMEFASEMVVKASLEGLQIVEVPTTLSPDGRGRPPHLRSWRDGWRHLRFLLLFCPRWLFLYPGAGLALLGMLQLVYSNLHAAGQTNWPVGIHTQLFASGAMIVGYQTTLFALGAILARHLAKLDAPHTRDQWARRMAMGSWLPIGGAVATLVGLSLCLSLTLQWGGSGFGALNPEVTMRQIIPGVALTLMGTQSVLASIFFAALRSAFDSNRIAPSPAESQRDMQVGAK